jgi:hypothetical protein
MARAGAAFMTAEFMARSQTPILGAAFSTKLTVAAWHQKPSYAIIASEDRSLDPAVARRMANRAGSTMTVIKGGHLIRAVARVIETAARAACFHAAGRYLRSGDRGDGCLAQPGPGRVKRATARGLAWRRKWATICSMPAPRCHSVMTRSAHSTRETKIAGLPNFAPHWVRSASVTPRAREHAPHAKI